MGFLTFVRDLLPNQPRPTAVVLTIPKSGTHLLKKILEEMVQGPLHPFGHTVNRAKTVKQVKKKIGGIFLDMLLPDYDFLRECRAKDYMKVVLIRDLRDVVVSFVHFMEAKEMAWMPIEQIREFNRLPFDERVSRLIEFPRTNCGTRWIAENFLKWQENETVLICRYEDLVGPRGGGNREKQEKAIKQIANHLNIPLSEERLSTILETSFGDTFTFRKGQIGDWKETFKPHHIELFKKTMGDTLSKMGYHDW